MYDASGLLGVVPGSLSQPMAKIWRSCYHRQHGGQIVQGTYLDSGGIEHTVQVSAQTLYEAVAQALRIFRDQSWCDHDLRQSAASVLVKIAPPQIEHR